MRLCQKSIKRSEPQRNRSVEYGPTSENKPRLFEAPGKVYTRSVQSHFESRRRRFSETVPVSKPAKRKLLAHNKSLIALAEKSTPIEKKKKILVQHGGNF